MPECKPAQKAMPPATVASTAISFKDIIPAVEQQMLDMGLVDVRRIDSTIMTDIRYSDTNNFLKQDIYGDFNKAYLQPDVAEKVKKAQAYLRELHPAYRLIIFDAARPLVFQQMIWDSLKMPVSEKVKYACSPRNGSLHNYGAAVDVCILDENHQLLDMGTPYDFFGPLAYPVKEAQFLADGSLTQQQVDNRRLLRQVMYKAGFFNIQTEWWHFNSCTRFEASQKYKIID